MASSGDKAIFYRCFSTLFQAGLHIVPSLQILCKQSQDPRLRLALEGVTTQVLGGQTLSTSMRREKSAFDPFEVHCVAAGEASGYLHHTLEALASHWEQQTRLNRQILQDLLYPVVVVLASLLMVACFPPLLSRHLRPVLAQLSVDLPAPTRALVALSHMLGEPLLWLALLGLGVGAWGAWRQLARRRQEELLLRIPVLGELLIDLHRMWFIKTLNLALHSGLSITEALVLAGAATGSPFFEEGCRRSVTALKNGETLSRAVCNSRLLPRWLEGFVEAGEQAGKLNFMLSRAGLLLEEHWQSRTQALLSMLQPVALAILGLIVGFVALGALLPITKMLENL